VGRVRFWLRWSVRDLRKRWIVVVAIAMTIAIGIGAYTGLSSMSEWRRASNDASFAKLAMHDLRIVLNTGSSVPEGELAAVAAAIPSGRAITAVDERLIAPTQVDVSTAGTTIVTPGRIVGAPVGEPQVDLIDAQRGRNLRADDAGSMVAVLDRSFARYYDLPDSGTLRLAGGHRVSYVGHGLAPEYFIVTTEVGFFGTEANFAVTFLPLRTAQAITGQPGRVNDLVLRLRPGVDVATVQRELQQSLAVTLPNVGATVQTRRDSDSYRILYDDIDGDQRIYDIFAIILLGAGTFAAFNLASRIVESQRRELGVGMALGVAPRVLAIRPLLLGAQIAVLGVLLGVPFGIWVGNAFLDVLTEVLPLPEYRSPFQTAIYLRGATLGVVLPIVATAWPTWRAVRMDPVRAVQAGFRSTRGSSLSRAARRLRLPGRTLARMPIRNLLRAPRRTLFTVLGIAAAVTTVVGVTGMVDSFVATIDRSTVALAGPSPDRMQVTLRDFLARDDPVVRRIGATRGVATAEPAILTGATLVTDKDRIDVVLETFDAGSEIWRPSLSAGSFPAGRDGIVITSKAADDLGVDVGESILLRHPRRISARQLQQVDTPIRVVGITPNPVRVYAYMDESRATLLGLSGATNLLNVAPVVGTDINELKRSILENDGVASAERVAASSEALSDALTSYTDILRVVEVVALALALLIAFNSASIAADERAREYATMFAYGVPIRTVLRNAMVEGGAAGILATLVGVGVGVLLIRYIVTVTTPRVLPDLGATVSVSAGTIALAAVLGVIATAIAPLLTARKLIRMDVPSTLRVVE
jgi:putative ABC transport system permease protein